MPPIGLPLALDVVGAAIATAALRPLRDIVGLVRTPKLKRAWRALTLVVVCCIGLVVASAVTLLGRESGASDVTAAIIHVLGPSFVLCVALLTRSTARDLLRVSALEKAAFEDPLTGLANRRRFDETLRAAWRRAAHANAPLSLLSLDVDGFKLLNDRNGHAQGDRCLRAVADAIRDSLRGGGDLAARYGGDEFVVLLPDTDATEAAIVAERIRLAVRRAGSLEAGRPNGTPAVTVSLGYATAIAGGADESGPAALFDEADARLYEAKRLGRDRVGPEPIDGDAARSMGVDPSLRAA